MDKTVVKCQPAATNNPSCFGEPTAPGESEHIELIGSEQTELIGKKGGSAEVPDQGVTSTLETGIKFLLLADRKVLQ